MKGSLPSVTFFVFAILLLTVQISAQMQTAPGDLDPTFGNGGRVTAENFLGAATAIQSDGKIVAVGRPGVGHAFTMERYNTDGSLDTSFGSGGRVDTGGGIGPGGIGVATYGADDVAIQSDGKIVVAGEAHLFDDQGFYDYATLPVVRYNTDGSLDSSFGIGGIVAIPFGSAIEGEAYSVAIQSDGKIVAAGYKRAADWDFLITRYYADGTLDTSWGPAGYVETSFAEGELGIDEANSVAIQADGKIVAAGHTRIYPARSSFALARYDADGELDASFGSGGKVITPFGDDSNFGAYSVAIQRDGRVLAAGSGGDYPNSGFALARYNMDGTLDNAFGQGGKVIAFGNGSHAEALIVQSDGRIISSGFVIEGNNRGVGLARFIADGSLDMSFGSGGKVFTPFFDGFRGNDAAIQSDGKIVVLASTRFPDPAFSIFRYRGGPGSASTTPFDFDGDGRADVSVFRPSSGAWYLQRSTAGLFGMEFGYGTDKIAPADYDGDGKTDIAVYRPETGIWYIYNSSTGTVSYNVFGLAEDLPTPADFDGDGRADVSVFRPSTGTWYRQNSSDGSFYAVQFGASEDKPTIGDFDGDGNADVAVFRPSTGAWYQLYSSDGSFHGQQFGFGTDAITPADYDGDGQTDLAVFRLSNGFWYIRNSNGPVYSAYPFGLSTDIPATGDFDGDGKADLSVFRPTDGTWYRKNSSDGSFFAFPFGTNGDKPTQTAFTY